MSALQRLLSGWNARRWQYDAIYQTVLNGAAEFGKRVEVVAGDSGDPLYFALDIPAGRQFVLFLRNLYLTEGAYDVDLVTAPSGWTGGTEAFKSPLRQGAEMAVETELMCGVTPVNPGEVSVVMELPRVDTGTTLGSARTGGAAASDAVLKMFQQDGILLRVQRVDAEEAYTASISLIAWEKPL